MTLHEELAKAKADLEKVTEERAEMSYRRTLALAERENLDEQIDIMEQELECLEDIIDEIRADIAGIDLELTEQSPEV